MGYSNLGLRLKDGDNYPYFVNTGFSEYFIAAENGLLSSISQAQENSREKTLNCLCGCVIQRNHHDETSIFNEYGSFWTNDLKALHNHPAKAVRQMLDNNRCLIDGYNSLALIPLRVDEWNYGLLQINDYEKDGFTESEIRFLEEIGQTLSIAIKRKQVEKELKDSELRIRSYLEYSPYGDFISDEKGNYKEVNPAACLITGYNAEELLSMNISDLLPADNLDDGLQQFNTLLETGHFYGETRYRQKSGEIRWGSVASVKISDTVFLGFYNNITERKEAEEELREAHSELQEMHLGLQQKVEKAVIELREKDHLIIEQSRQRVRSEMLSQIAHHWRQPLNSISVQIQNIGDAYEFDELDQEEMSKRMDKVLFTIDSLSRSIDSFRNVYYGQKEIVEFDVNELLSEIIFLYRDRFSNSGIEFVSSLEFVGFLQAVPSDYAQAVINILDNAYEILVNRKVKNPRVSLTCGCEDERFIVSIRDNGGGIDPSIREKMFELYESSKENLNNTGIGLYFSKMIIVEQMGGKIEVLDHEDGVEFKLVNSVVKKRETGEVRRET
jgi:PAS domain S-box-containing protein